MPNLKEAARAAKAKLEHKFIVLRTEVANGLYRFNKDYKELLTKALEEFIESGKKRKPEWLVKGFPTAKFIAEKGWVWHDEEGYAGKILVFVIEDPNTDQLMQKREGTAFVIYVSTQTSKKFVPSQAKRVADRIYEVVHKYRSAGYTVFPFLLAPRGTTGNALQLLTQKFMINVYQSVDEVVKAIGEKVLARLKKVVEAMKFRGKMDALVEFLMFLVTKLNVDLPMDLYFGWANKPSLEQFFR
jgi:hypothetical protein